MGKENKKGLLPNRFQSFIFTNFKKIFLKLIKSNYLANELTFNASLDFFLETVFFLRTPFVTALSNSL